MNADDPKALLVAVFARLRAGGFRLGVGELLDALRAVDGGWGAGGQDDLERLGHLLWCRTRSDALGFATVWAAMKAEREVSTEVKTEEEPPPEGVPSDPPRSEDRPFGSGSPSRVATGIETARAERWTPLPVRAPDRSDPVTGPVGLEADGPLSCRDMVYLWRQLRKPMPDGPEDLLDVDATVELASRLGFYLSPVYRRRVRNHAHLVLMIDQGGSMTPFHRFTRDLVATARHESTLRLVDVYYFHNVPTAHLFLDPHLTDPVSWTRVAAQCTAETGALLVGDAGAARGYRRPDRIRATGEFLGRLGRQTSLIAWLNPMPRDRWSGTSARIVAGLVPMFPMEPEGLGHAVDVLRGLSPPVHG